MKQTVDIYSFRDAFKTRPDNFTYQGLEVLYDYLNEIDEDMELDVIAICCDYSEDYSADIAANYDIDVEGLGDDELTETVREYLIENTILVGETNSTFIYFIF